MIDGLSEAIPNTTPAQQEKRASPLNRVTATLDKDDIATYGADYVHFCRKLKTLTAIDLGNYKGQQMHRRLQTYRVRNEMPDFACLARAVERDPEKLRSLVDYLTINVSEFFRNPDQWRVLRESVLPLLLRDSMIGAVKVWSAGSSSGQEAYSLAMTLFEMGSQHSSILGTDIDEPSLKKAGLGIYTRDEVASVSRYLLTKHFAVDGSRFRVADRIKRMVTFRRGDLLADTYPSDLDLILCRNVLIYFTEKGKNRVIKSMADALRPGGVLFTGATEAIFNPATYGLRQIQPFFYRRVNDGRE